MDDSICTLTVEPEPCGTASQVTVTLEGKQLMCIVLDSYQQLFFYILRTQLYSIIENVICRTNIRNLFCSSRYVPRGDFTNLFAHN